MKFLNKVKNDLSILGRKMMKQLGTLRYLVFKLKNPIMPAADHLTR